MPEEGGDVFDYNLPEAWEAGPSVHYSKASKKNMKCLKMTNNDVLIQIVGFSCCSISKALEVNILNHSVMPLILFFFLNFILKKVYLLTLNLSECLMIESPLKGYPFLYYL